MGKDKFLSIGLAKERIAGEVRPISDWEAVHVRDALGRICAEDVVSPIDVPNHRNSAMDGYSLRMADVTPGSENSLGVLGAAMAGAPFEGEPSPGGCVKIMTGAVVPEGHDAVIPKEDVSEATDERITFQAEGVAEGQNLRHPGEDLRAGEVAVAAGKWMRPAEVGLVASLGIGEVRVVRRPRIAFFSTGDELRSIGEQAGPGQIFDSNRHVLSGMVRRMGFVPVDLGVVRDDPAALQGTLDQAKGADAIITSGGVSVGEADHVKGLLEKNGEVLFWKIAMKPGRPLAFGRVGGALFFGLPGNPVSVMVTFHMIVQDALWTLAGRKGPRHIPTVRARAAGPVRKMPGRVEYQRCTLAPDGAGGFVAKSTGQQGSGILRSMSMANGLMVLGEDVSGLEKGDEVDVVVLEGIV